MKISLTDPSPFYECQTCSTLKIDVFGVILETTTVLRNVHAINDLLMQIIKHKQSLGGAFATFLLLGAFLVPLVHFLNLHNVTLLQAKKSGNTINITLLFLSLCSQTSHKLKMCDTYGNKTTL